MPGGPQGPAIVDEDLFAALVNWVENGVAPDYIVAAQENPTGATVIRTRKRRTSFSAGNLRCTRSAA